MNAHQRRKTLRKLPSLPEHYTEMCDTCYLHSPKGSTACKPRLPFATNIEKLRVARWEAGFAQWAH